MKTKIILIGGGSASGKSLLCEEIQKAIKDVSILHIDNFYKNNTHLSFEQRTKVNYDEPNAYEIELLLEKLKEYQQNKDINIPTYDFKNHLRSNEIETIKFNKYLLIDGIFALYFKELLDISDYKIFINATEDIRLNRRINRDIILRGRSKESVIKQFKETVKPMHDLYVEPCKANADYIFINNKNDGLDTFQVNTIINKILTL